MKRNLAVMVALVALVLGTIGALARWQKDDGPGVMLNPDGFIERAREVTELDLAERERLAGLRMSPKTLVNPTVFSLNRGALQGRAIIVKLPDGRQFRYVGSPVSNWPQAAWTGRSRSNGGLMLDDTAQELVGEVWEGGIIYIIGSLPGGRHQVVSVLGNGVFYEPPQMSGHPRFPVGVTGQ